MCCVQTTLARNRAHHEMSQPPHNRASWLLQLAVAGSALALGAIDVRVLALVVAVLAVASVFAWWDSGPVTLRLPATLVLSVCVGLTLMTALQCVPMPQAWLARIAPHTADIWSRALHPLGGVTTGWRTLSLDPGATRVELLRGAAYTLAFAVAVRSADRRQDDAVKRTLICIGALVIALAAVHYALNIREVYGFYKPRTGVTSISPFLNGNHLCAYGNIALVLAYASALSPTPIFPRPLLVVVIVVAATSDIFWASRGGVASCVVGMILVTLLALRERARGVVSFVVPAIVAIAGAAMVVFSTRPTSMQDLGDTDLSKFQITKQVLGNMVPSYWAFGAGRGAFESTFPEFRVGRGFVVWTHPENLVAEWASGWGVPVTIVAIVTLMIALRPRSVLSRRMVGPWVAIVVVVLHNMVDFSLEIPGVGVALAVCAGLVTKGAPHVRYAGSRERRLQHIRALVVTSSVASIVAIAVSLARGNDLIADRDEIQRTIRGDPSRAEARATLASAMIRHPAEPYFAYAGAVYAGLHDESPISWIDHTLERAPVYPPAHLALARWLRRRAPAQARLEYRLYLEQGGDKAIDARELGALIGSFDDVLETVPTGPIGVDLLDQVSVRIHDHLPATAKRTDDEILRRNPSAAPAIARGAKDALADLDESWCEAAFGRCSAAALQAVERAERATPSKCGAFALHARVLARTGDVKAALETLRQAAATADDRANCDEVRAELAIVAHRYDDATDALDALITAPCQPADCVDNLLRAVTLETRRGSRNRALVELARAAELAPNDEGLLERLAAENARAGLHRAAAALYRRLDAAHPGRFTQAILREEAAGMP